MDFHSSSFFRTNENKNRHLITFTLQIFYSDTLEFQECNSLLSSISVKPEEEFEIKLNLSNSPKFIRIDPGRLYSVHINPSSNIMRLNQQEEIEMVSFNPNTFLHKSSDLHLEFLNNQTFMVCGLDAWYIFENPFFGYDICINFTSQILMGISE